MGHTCVMYGLCLLLVSPVFSLDLVHIRRLRRDTDDATDDKGSTLPKFSLSELGDKLKDLLDRDRPDGGGQGRGRPWDRDDDRDFEGLFSKLDDIADRIPDDLTGFDIASFMGQARPAAQAAAQANACLKDPNRLREFMKDLHEAVRELRQDILEDITDTRSRDADTHDKPDVADDTNSDNDDTPTTSNERVEEALSDMRDTVKDAVTEDADKDDAVAAPLVAASNDKDKTDDKSKDTDDFDVEDILEKLTEGSVECMTAFFDDKDEEVLCRQLSHQSSRVFQMFLKAGADCDDFLDSDEVSRSLENVYASVHDTFDDIDDAFKEIYEQFDNKGDDDYEIDDKDLDEAHQMALLKQLMSKPRATWTVEDLKKALTLAPDVIDDDLLEDLSDDLLEDNLSLLGRIAARKGANPGLQLGFRRRILAGRNISSLDALAISGLGKGLLAFSEDDLDELDPQALLEADLGDLFDNDSDDSREKDDDDDDDDDDGLRLALGRRMKQGQISGPQQVGKVARLLFDDLDFLESVDPDDLYDSLDDLKDLDLDDDDAANLFRRMSQSDKFPRPELFSAQDILKVRAVLPGMGLSQLQQLPRQSVRLGLDALKNLDFDESQARELFDELFDVEPKDLTSAQLRSVGKLALGLDADDIEEMKDDVVDDLLDDLDDLDLNDAQKRLFADKVRQQVLSKAKLLTLPGFAGAVSVDDIDDLADDDVITSLNITNTINWRASQAASLMSKVKHSLGNRSLRPADLPSLGNLARGLLPRDIDDMVDRDEDVDDLADILGDRMDEMMSSQVDKMLEKIRDADRFDDLDDIKVTAEYVAQKGAFLAYLPQDLFKKLEFDEGGKKAFVLMMSRMDVSKLPRAQLKFLADELKDMMEIKVGEYKDDSDFRKLKQLGQFALGLTPDQIDDMSPSAVLHNLGLLGILPFTRKQAEAILDKLEDAMPDWECKSSILVNAGPLLQFAKDDVIEALCEKELAAGFSSIEKRLERHHERVEERREEGLWREDSNELPDLKIDTPDTPDVKDAIDDMTENISGKEKLVQRMLFAAMATRAQKNVAGRRRRQAASQLTCSVLRQLHQDVVLADVSQIITMPDTEFRDCLQVLGNASSWNRNDLVMLKQRAEQVLGMPSTWTNELIRQAGVLVSAFTLTEIRQLAITGVDALNSVGKHARLDAAQLAAGFNKWLELKKANNLATITPGEFSSLSEFVCGLTTQQIQQLPIEAYKRSIDVVGSARSCSAEQRAAYADRALEGYGNSLQQWPPSVVAELGNVIGGLSSPSVQQLTADQLALIKPNVLATLPSSSLKAMSDSQLKMLSTNQVNALQQSQYNSLTKTQQNIISGKATVAFQKATVPGGSGGNASVADTGNTTSASVVAPSTTSTGSPTTTTPVVTSTTPMNTPTQPQTTKPPMTTKQSVEVKTIRDLQTTVPTTIMMTTPEPPFNPNVEYFTEFFPNEEHFTESTRLIQTTTRKAIIVKTSTPTPTMGSFQAKTMQSSVRPDSIRGDNPWVDESKSDGNQQTAGNNITYTSGGDGTTSVRDTPKASEIQNSAVNKSTWQLDSSSSKGTAAGLTWSLSAIIATLLFSFLV